jgi:hypothetical protein
MAIMSIHQIIVALILAHYQIVFTAVLIMFAVDALNFTIGPEVSVLPELVCYAQMEQVDLYQPIA